jgi:GNAT superfamily N-acetyltransferase
MLVTIRRAAAEDAPTLARLSWRWRGEEHDEPGADRTAFLELFTTWMLDHRTTHLPFLAEVDGAVSGMAWLMLGERVPSPIRPARPMGDIQSVYVVPELRNSGVGSALLTAILIEARHREMEVVTVHSARRALPFYLRCGFAGGRNWLEWRP